MHWAQTLIGKIALMCLFAAISFPILEDTDTKQAPPWGPRGSARAQVVPTQTQIVDSQGTVDGLDSWAYNGLCSEVVRSRRKGIQTKTPCKYACQECWSRCGWWLCPPPVFYKKKKRQIKVCEEIQILAGVKEYMVHTSDHTAAGRAQN